MILTRRSLSASLGLSLGLPTLAARAATNPSVLLEAMKDTQVPGMTAVVIRDFRAEPEQVAGIRDLVSKAPVVPGARWHMGSNAKALTATLVARLVEAGALAWDRPLSSMLPDLLPGMNPAYRDVTLPDLLSHHAGLPENATNLDFFNTLYDSRASMTDQRLSYISRCLAEAPIGPPQAEASYSNTGLLIAAACAEQATGKSYETLIQSRLFVPLGMTGLSYDQLGGPGEPKGHIDGRVADRPQDANPRMFAPAGAMRMTMSDWARFCIDQMKGEHGKGRLLKTESYKFLHAPQGAQTDGAGWALGWGAAPNPMKLRGPALTHSGSDGNWYALVCLFPQTGNGVLVVSNTAETMGGDVATLTATRALAKTVAPLAA